MLVAIFPSITKAYSTDGKELAKQSVNNYIKAIQNRNVDEASKWVIDTRFNSTAEQISEYKELLSTNPFSKVYLERINANSDYSFTATLNLVRKDNNEVNKVSLPVINKDGKWKLLIEGQETMSSAVKGEIQLDKKLSGLSDDTITPMAAVHVGSYNDWLAKSGSTYSGSFDMIGKIIGVSGWQYQPAFTDARTVIYQIVKKGFFSDDVKGETTLTGYYTDESASGSSFYLTVSVTDGSSSLQGVSVKAKNASSISGVFVKGFIYENR